MSRKLTLDDISDLRAYERDREEVRSRIIALRRLRRVSLGPVVSLAFESRETIRYQIQEMARAEKMLTDEAVQGELDSYNPLIPEPGHLSATLFLELVDDATMREWLPKLVGIESSIVIRIGPREGDDTADLVRSVAEEAHAEALTREEMTAAVHYVFFELTSEQVERFATSPVAIEVDHPNYAASSELGDELRSELLGDLRADRTG